jgi:hypothetical protein
VEQFEQAWAEKSADTAPVLALDLGLVDDPGAETWPGWLTDLHVVLMNRFWDFKAFAERVRRLRQACPGLPDDPCIPVRVGGASLPTEQESEPQRLPTLIPSAARPLGAEEEEDDRDGG